MLLTFNEVLKAINNVRVVDHFTPDRTTCYLGIRFLHNKSDVIKERYIYIGRSSMLPECLPLKNVAFMVIDDCGYNFSGCNLDIVLLSEDTDLYKLGLEIERQVFLSEEEYDALEKMLFSMLAEKPIEEIIDYCYKLLRNPIVITAGAKLVYITPKSGISDPIFLDMLKNGAVSSDMQLAIDEYGLTEKLDETPTSLLLDYGIFKSRRIVGKITAGIHRVGCLVMIESEKQFDPDDEIYIDIVCRVISHKLDTHICVDDFIGLLFEQRFLDLLNGCHEEISDDSTWLNIINAREYKNFRVAVVRFDNPVAQIRNAVKWRVEHKLYFCHSVIYGEDMVFLCNPKSVDEYDWMLREFQEDMSLFQLNIGISDTFSSLETIENSYRQAVLALDACKHLGLKDNLVEFDKQAANILLYEASRHVRLEEYASAGLRKIVKTDEKSGTEFYRTLLCYLASGANKQKTCVYMSIHRNTLAYRLEKIERLIGHTLEDGEYMLNLFFSSKVNETLDTKKTGGGG